MARENQSHSIPRKRKEAAASLLPLSASFLFHFFLLENMQLPSLSFSYDESLSSSLLHLFFIDTSCVFLLIFVFLQNLMVWKFVKFKI
jgi:hypothetical protein